MCQSKAYLLRDGAEVLVLDEVSSVAIAGSQITLRPLFGEPVLVNGRIREIDLMSHRIVLDLDPAASGNITGSRTPR